MKSILLRAGLVLGACASAVSALAYLPEPSDSQASAATKNLYYHIASRAGQTDNTMIEGQHLGGINEVLYPAIYGTFDINDHVIDGKVPGLVGSRYDAVDKEQNLYVLDPAVCTAINQKLIAAWNEHQAIIHVTAVPPNPWNFQSGRDPYRTTDNISELFWSAPTSDARTSFWNSMAIIADALEEFQNAGIPVIFRPFAEFNMTNKYYYAHQNAADFVQLWKDVRDYCVNTRGLHNLLFCWEVWALNRNTATADIAPWYPGDGYVDIVGGAYYFRPDIQYIDPVTGEFSFANSDPEDQGIFDFLVAQNRPFGAPQWGLNYSPTGGGGYGDHDFTRKFMDFAPQLAFAYYWMKQYAVENQSHGTEFVNDHRVATADDLPGFSSLTFTSIATADGWVLESSETSNAGGSLDATATGNSALKTGDNASKQQFKSILSFNTSALPDDATITGAALVLTRGSQSGNPTATLGSLQADIKTGSFGPLADLEIGDFEAGYTYANVASLAVPANDGETAIGALDVNGLSAIKKNGKTQFRLYFSTDDDNDGVGDNIGWYSGEAAVPENRPQLTVNYKVLTP
ncbi:MAG: hypothetical protein HYV96_14700 [Opitutae bacterium]|nr:hypothetical protein [Opitutae bacterium]